MSKILEVKNMVEDKLKELENKVRKARDGKEFKNYLQFIGKFHNYSLRNQVLINLYNPNATMVAGFNAWRKIGRNVKKGEKGIPILAPMVRKVKEESEEKNILSGFRVAYVFDISQTEGEDIPSINIVSKEEEDGGLLEKLLKVAEKWGLEVSIEEIKDGSEGSFNRATKEIKLKEGNTKAGLAGILAHELGHYLLHSKEEEREDRQTREVEAESFAYAVCSQYGVEKFAENYLACWSLEEGQLQEVLSRVQVAVSKIMQELA